MPTKPVVFTLELRQRIERLARDKERLRLAFEELECLESMVLYRGPENQQPRVRVLRLIAEMQEVLRDESREVVYFEGLCLTNTESGLIYGAAI